MLVSTQELVDKVTRLASFCTRCLQGGWLFASCRLYCLMIYKCSLKLQLFLLWMESFVTIKNWRNFDKISFKVLTQIEVKKWNNCQTLFGETSKKHVLRAFKPMIGKSFSQRSWRHFCFFFTRRIKVTLT